MNGLPYYKRYPRDFIEGTVRLPFELKVTYSYILDLIYLQGGQLPDDPRYIGGLLGVSVRKWNSLRNGLLEAGKIQAENGYLTNYRAVSELESLAKLQDKQRENRLGSSKNKDLQKPRFNHTEPEPEAERKNGVGGTREGFIDEILKAARIDIHKARNPTAWMDGAIEARLVAWRRLGLTDAEVLSVIEAVMQRKDDGPPGVISYFDGAMERAAGRKRPPDLKPIEGGRMETDDERRHRQSREVLAKMRSEA